MIFLKIACNGPGYTQAGIPENNLFIPFHQNSCGGQRRNWRSLALPAAVDSFF
jgi:hypothetical protein